MRWLAAALLLAACGDDHASTPDASSSDAPESADAGVLGGVMNVRDLSPCPAGAPAGSTCKQITVAGCPGIESQSIDAVVAILPQPGTLKGTIVHLSGGGGEGFQGNGAMPYATAGFRQVFVSWNSDWEQTQAQGIKAAGCRPATVLEWIFTDLHGGDRSTAFCGEGFSGGTGQLGYALANYGLKDRLDYVNELSGPPFARIDLGCDGDQPATAPVCGGQQTVRLPVMLDMWENIQAPASCGGTGIPAAEVARWQSDSIAVGGDYAYPQTVVEFYVCTYQPTAVTAQAQFFHDALAAAGTTVGFHCYAQSDGCQHENLGTGAQDAIQSMIAGCVPRHQ